MCSRMITQRKAFLPPLGACILRVYDGLSGGVFCFSLVFHLQENASYFKWLWMAASESAAPTNELTTQGKLKTFKFLPLGST